ncbi:Alpha/Beta hydrolase protein [Mycena sp. CBHHK59/15]|nr:Alpha/Beta hydrolase protein [Mycena sp. CBHHK59/15]
MILSAKLAICFVGATTVTATSAANNSFNVKPFKISLTNKVARMNALVANTHLPAQPLYPNVGFDKGIKLDYLRELQREWVGSFDWESQEAELNQFNHYTAEIEGQTVHFIHEISTEPDAIPLILLHRWPGSFQEFAPVIKPLTQSWTSPSRKAVSYNVVVPSLPGFVFSPVPPPNWTIDDTARIFNTLMTDVLGYSNYALHGTDWGSAVGYSLYSFFSATVLADHFVFLHIFPPSAQEIAARNITLTAQQNVTEQRYIEFTTSGMGYFMEQTNRPNDIGLALYDNPVGQLAWMGSLWKTGSDPRAGTPPSVLTDTAILTSLSLYYLTQSFLSSFSKAPTDAPMLFSQFEYNIVFWPEEWVAEVGNLVSYKFHDFGGHWAGLDNPPALIEDIREMGLYFI